MDKRSSLKNKYQSTVDEYRDVTPAMILLFEALWDIEELAGFPPV
jgi:hypothetical protein